VPRRGYKDISIREESWRKLQELKVLLEANTYDELISKLYDAVVKRNRVEVEKLLRAIASLRDDLESLRSDVEKLRRRIERLEGI